MRGRGGGVGRGRGRGRGKVLPEQPDSPPSDIQDDDMEPSSEISMQEPESEGEYEEVRRGPGKAATKRGGRKQETYSGKKKKGGAASTMTDDSEGSLFEIVKSGKTALSAVVDDWIEAYKQDRDAALLDLIQFFIHCSGCKGRISAHMYHNMEHAEIIRKMTEEFDEESGDYPLIMSGPQWKKFKANFCEFILVLVRQCQYSIIYDQYMMDNIISLLTGLTDSQVRAFRHTSTLASMKLMTALVDVALGLSINLDHTQRQYEAERAKGKSKQASERLEMLIQKRQEIEESQEEIRNMLTYIFRGVFVHRYRDTQPEIRGICMAEIGVWMKRYPGMFLDDSYLKYVGWTLYDRVGDVRLCCLRCLQPLCDTDELAPKLELFTSRFRDRMVEMTLDKEYDVAVAAVKLVTQVLRFTDNVLSDKDCENVYELVYSSHRAVAQAAGEFLNAKLFTREPDEATKNLKSKKGKKRSENTPLIRDLVQFFIESELHEHGAYLVDSLWEINDMLKDWECMTDLLLEEPGRGEDAMDDRQETSLIEIMVCCVKQAATGEYPVGRGPTRKLTTKEGKQVAEDKTRLTEHFIVTLPQLLAKYNVDSEKVANLLQISLYFDLEIYTTSRLEKHLDALLRHISDIVDKHTDSEVLENASKVLENLCNDGYSISGKCNVAKSTLIDNLVQKYKVSFQDFFQEGEEPDEDDAYALMASLKRIYAFFCCHDLNGWNLWDSLFAIVKGGQEGSGIPEEIVCKAISCCSTSIIWHLDSLDESNPDKLSMKELKKHLTQYMRVCHELLFHQQDKIQEEAYITICDMLIIFSEHVTQSPQFEPLVFKPDRNLQGQLGAFLNDKVFIEDDDDEIDENRKIEELHKRRNFLASFCKLVVYNVVQIKMAADMFKYYMKFYNDYGDIIKATLGKSREINKVMTAKTLAMSLTQLFKELQHDQNFIIERSSEPFQAIKELARRFSLSFGLDQVKNRDAVAAMHKEGIVFSLGPHDNAPIANGPPANIAFLEILTEFTSKLMRQDKKTVLAFLDKYIANLHVEDTELWGPMQTYRNSLVQGEDGHEGGTGRKASRRKAAKRKIPIDLSAAHQGDDTTSQWLHKTPGRGIPGPMTSTAIKKRKTDEESEIGTESEIGSERDFDMGTQPPGMWGVRSVDQTLTPQNGNKRGAKRKRKASTSSNTSKKRTTRSSGGKGDSIFTGDSENYNNIDEFDSPAPIGRIVRKTNRKVNAKTRGPATKRTVPQIFEDSPLIDEFSEELGASLH